MKDINLNINSPRVGIIMGSDSDLEVMKNAAGSVTPTSVRAAATILTMLPIICIYPFLQKYFIAGLTLGGVKE